MQVFVRDDLVQVGITEDGEADLALCFYVVAEAPSGRRWAHDYSLVLHRAAQDRRSVVDGLAARVQAHLDAGGRIDPDHWDEIDPVYGSAAYQDADATGYFLARERHEARQGGEAVPFDLALDAHFA